MEIEEKKWCVYIHRNKINNKAYIGITSQDLKNRWGNKGCRYNKDKQPVFYRAIQKYGWDNFEHIIWAENLTEKEAKAWEIRLIAIFQTNCCRYRDPKHGYNMTDGGDGTSGHIWSEESKQKLRRSLKGKMIGENNPMYGTHRTQEHIEYMKNLMSGEKNPNYGKGKNVVQLSLEGEYMVEYVSANEAQRVTGINKVTIKRCCKHKSYHKTAGGFKWMYKDEYEVLNNHDKCLTN